MVKLAVFPGALIAASLSETLSLGKILVGVLISVGTLITLLYGVKYRVLADQQALTIGNLEADRNTWRDIAQNRARELQAAHAEKQTILKTVADLKEEKARLEALPNLSIIIEQMSKEAQRSERKSQERVDAIVNGFTSVMDAHEKAAGQRHTELIQALRQRADQPPKGTRQ